MFCVYFCQKNESLEETFQKACWQDAQDFFLALVQTFRIFPHETVMKSMMLMQCKGCRTAGFVTNGAMDILV